MVINRLQGGYEATSLPLVRSALSSLLPLAFPLEGFREGDTLFYTTQWGYAFKGADGKQMVSGFADFHIGFGGLDTRLWSPFEHQDLGPLVITPIRRSYSKLFGIGYREINRRSGDPTFATYDALVNGVMQHLEGVDVEKVKNNLERPLLAVDDRVEIGYQLAITQDLIDVNVAWLKHP